MISSLSSGTIEVRYVLTEDIGDEAYAKLLTRLPIDERETANRYLHLKDRLAFVATRVLLRAMLSLCCKAPAGGWHFIRNRYSKPAIVRAEGTPDLQFNISHCAGMIAVALSLGHPVGVDVECITDTKLNYLELAHAYFSESENRLLASHAGVRQREIFYELWTLKEAYLKACGEGLSGTTSKCSFALHPCAVSFSPPDMERASRWFFLQSSPTSRHRMAIAAQRRHPGDALACNIRELAFADLVETSSL